jgi:general secretion pathway protein F/type IV pilus assembly protein PilC
MSQFTYSAINGSGQKVLGQLDAASRGDALQALAQQALMPLTLMEARVTPLRNQRVKPAAIAAACSLLADQLDTGVPLLKALRVMAQQTSSTGLRTALTRIAERVADGSSLADAMTEHGTLFGELEVSMVRAGEEGGFLDESLRRLAIVRERQEEIRGRLLSALAYPALLSIVGSLVVVGMLTFFVPKFEPLFESLRQSNRMPMPTTILLAVSGFLQSWGLPLLVLLVVTIVIAKSLIPAEKIRMFRDRHSLRMKGIGPVVQSLAIARFCRVLGTLLQNGVPMLKSLDIARSATGNRVLSETIAAAAENIGAGKSLSIPLAASGHFPADVLEMLSVAEQSNKLESVLLKLADKLESRSQLRLDMLMKLLEPLMMVVMAIVVGFLVIALLMPVFEGNGLS